ncbi:hypothetical protein ACTGJ9_006480 [Bradyrhizobium sp. RDM12]
MGLFSQACVGAHAQTLAQPLARTPATETRVAQAVLPDDAPPPRRRPQTRLRVTPYYVPDGVYPRFNPGPDAVRECNATYVQEFRPSGTVIVPHMSCYWRRG